MNATIRRIARAILPRFVRHKLVPVYEWSGVLLNYLMMRSSTANLFGIVPARPNALYAVYRGHQYL